MQKRKSLFSVALLVLVLILTVSVLVACNKDKTEYTITFEGTDPLKTVTLEEGKTLTAEQIPAGPAVVGKTFVGWYVGETLVEAGYALTKDVTATAKYDTVTVTVNFVNGATTESATVDYNTAIASDDLPADAQPSDGRIYAFEGWFDGETKFESNMTFTENKTFTAKFKRTAYLVTFTNTSVEPTLNHENVIQKNESGATLLSAEKIPSGTVDVPTVANKAFVGFFNGSVKAVANMEITDDVTFVACYVGEADYTGVWVDEGKKTVLYFDIENDKLCVGKTYTYISNLTFDTATGKMEGSDSSTSWSLSIGGNTLTVVKTPNIGDPETYNTKKVTGNDEFKGKYYRDNKYSNTITFVDGGYAIADYYGISYPYAKLAFVDGTYKFITFDEAGDETTVDAKVVADGVVLIEGSISQKGIWVRGSDLQFNISDEDNEVTLIKHDVDGSAVYVYVDKNEVWSVVTPDKEIDEEQTAVYTLGFAGGNNLIIKVVSGTYSSTIVFAGTEKGTYKLTNNGITQTMVLDGFGTATFSGGENGTPTEPVEYVVLEENLIYFESYEQRVKLEGETYSVVEQDGLAGQFSQLNNNHYSSASKLEFDGYGKVIARSGLSSISPINGTYTINIEDETITIAGIEDGEEFFDGVYEVLYGGETLCFNGKYFGKVNQDESKIDIMEGKWYISDTNNSIMITNDFGDIEISLNGTSATNVKPVKYDKSVFMFEVEGTVYTATLGDIVEGSYTLILSSTDDEATYTASPSASAMLFGTWTNADETIKIEVADKYTVNVDFDVNNDICDSAFLIASNIDENTLTVKSQDINYVIRLLTATTLQVENEAGGILFELEKSLIPDSNFYGTWTWDDSRYQDMDPVIGTLIITANSVTLNDSEVENISFSNGTLSFTHNGNNFEIYSSYGSYRIDMTNKSGAYVYLQKSSN